PEARAAAREARSLPRGRRTARSGPALDGDALGPEFFRRAPRPSRHRRPRGHAIRPHRRSGPAARGSGIARAFHFRAIRSGGVKLHDSEKSMKVVLFCGGLGMRLREYSEIIPKPMVNIGYRPILWHVMKYYAH